MPITLTLAKPTHKPEKVYDFYKDGITQSLLKTWRSTCPQKADFTLRRMHIPAFSEALIFGEVFHKGIESACTLIRDGLVDNPELIPIETLVMQDIRKSLDPRFLMNENAKVKELYEKCVAMTEVMLPYYFQAWSDDFFGPDKKTWVELEKKFSMPIPECKNAPFRGRRDGVFRNKQGELWLLENKTKSSWDEENLSQFISRDLQCTSYCKTIEFDYQERPAGILYNLIRKPALRFGKTDTLQTFCQRLSEDISERMDFYFSRIEIAMPWPAVEQAWARTLEDIKDFEAWCLTRQWQQENKLIGQYTENCVNNYGACPYLSHCSSGFTDTFGISTMEDFFPELVGE